MNYSPTTPSTTGFTPLSDDELNELHRYFTLNRPDAVEDLEEAIRPFLDRIDQNSRLLLRDTDRVEAGEAVSALLVAAGVHTDGFRVLAGSSAQESILGPYAAATADETPDGGSASGYTT